MNMAFFDAGIGGFVFAIGFGAEDSGVFHFVKSGVIQFFVTVLSPHPVLNCPSNLPRIASSAAFRPGIAPGYRPLALDRVARGLIGAQWRLDSSPVH